MARSHQLLVATVLGALLVQCALAFTPPPAPRIKTRDGAVAFGTFSVAQSFYDSTAASDISRAFAMYNGSSWVHLPVYTDRILDYVQLPNGTIFFGGSFSNLHGITCGNIGAVDPDGTVRCLDQGLNGAVHSVVWVNDQLWIGGAFTAANGWYYAYEERLSYVCYWDGTFRPAPFQGVNGYVNKLAVDEYGRVWAAGQFSQTSDTVLPLTKVNIRNVTSDYTRHNSADPRVLIDDTINDSAAQTWLARDLVLPATVIVDLGIQMTVKRIDLRNTRYEGRGTHEVQFACAATSTSSLTNINTKTFNMFNAQETGSAFTQIVDRLPELGLQTFYVTSGGTNCRFLTIRMTSLYGNGAGLSHIAVYTNSFVMAAGPYRLPNFELSTVGTWEQQGNWDDSNGEALVGYIQQSNTERPSITFKPNLALAGQYTLQVAPVCLSGFSCYGGRLDLVIATPGFETNTRKIYNNNMYSSVFYMASGTTITITLPEYEIAYDNQTVAIDIMTLTKGVTIDHARNIAIYDPKDASRLDLLDQPLPASARINDIAFRFPNVYIGGLFTIGNPGDEVYAQNIIRYAGGELRPLAGNGLNREVRTITVIDDNTLFVGGAFDQDTNSTVRLLAGALYRNDEWLPVAGGLVSQSTTTGVYSSLLVNGSSLVISGDFREVYPADDRFLISASGVVLYDIANNTFNSMGLVGSTSVYSINSISHHLKLRKGRGNSVMIGGSIYRSLGTPANNLFAMYGDRLQAVDGGFDRSRSTSVVGSTALIYAAAYVDQTLYVGGAIYVQGLDNKRTSRIARYTTLDGWQPLRHGLDGTVNTLVEIDNMLWVGGVFSRSFDPVTGASQTLRGLAVWNGTDFISPFPQLGNGVVNVITPAYSGGKTYVFVGGTFTTAGNIVCNRICMWDGERWHALGLGVSGTVRAIEVAGSDVFVAGNFQFAGGVRVERIARWNHREGTWTPLETPDFNGWFETSPNAEVTSMVVVHSKSIFISGSFTTSGSNRYLGHYDGETFTYFGNMTSGSINKIKLWDTNNAVWGPDGRIPSGQSLLVSGCNIDLRNGERASLAIYDGVNWRGVVATSSSIAPVSTNNGCVQGLIDGPKPIGLEAYQIGLIAGFSVLAFLLIILLLVLFLVILPRRRAGGSSSSSSKQSKPKKEKTPKAQKMTDPEAASPVDKAEPTTAVAAAAVTATPSRPSRPQSEAVRMSTFGGGSVKRTSVAKYDFSASEDNEVSFRAGDVVSIIEDDDKDWWEGEVNGQRGLFPAAYVE